MNPEFKAISYNISNLQIGLSESREAAWWFCKLEDINEWKGHPANRENTNGEKYLKKPVRVARSDKCTFLIKSFDLNDK